MPDVPPPPARPSRMQYQNGPLGDDDYEIEEGSTITICKLIFQFLLEMANRVIRFFTEHTFTDRSEEMALFFANMLFLAGINYTIRRAPSPSRGAKKQFVLIINTPGNDFDYQITITVPWIENERLIQRLAKLYTCKNDVYRRGLLRALIYHIKIDETGDLFGEEAYEAFFKHRKYLREHPPPHRGGPLLSG